MEPFTQEGLARREKEATKNDKPEEEGEETTNDLKYPLELYNYKLSGVLVHSGFAEGGHYYSFIKDRENEIEKDQWYEFNDELVKEFDKEDIESECFGGEEKFSDMMGHSFYIKSSEKHRNAYVLFYEKTSNEDIPYSDSEDEAEKNPTEENNESSDINMTSEHEEAVMVKQPKLKRTTTVKIPDEISETLIEENRKYWQYRFMFSLEYSDFILELCTLWNSMNITPLNYETKNNDYNILNINEEEYKKKIEDLSKAEALAGVYVDPSRKLLHCKNIKHLPEKKILPSEYINILQKYAPDGNTEQIENFEHEVFKLTLTFYLTVKQRAQDKDMIPEFIDLIKSYINKSTRASEWCIKQFSNNEIIAENLLQCPVTDMRKLSAGIMYCAMLKLYENEKDVLNSYWEYKEGKCDTFQKTYLGNFINLLISNFDNAHNYSEQNSQYFQLIARFSSLGKEARLYLLKAKIVGRIFNYYLNDSSQFQEFFNDFSDVEFEENQLIEIGFPMKSEDMKLTLWEELIQKKRDTQIADGQQDYTFIFEILSNCLTSCVINTDDGDTFKDDLRYTGLHPNELELLKLDEKDITGILETCTIPCHNKAAIKNLGNVLLHLTVDNKEFDAMLRNVLVSGINDKQLEELKPYFPIFKRYLFIQDQYSEDRLNEGIREYFGILRSNIKFGSFMQCFTGFLVKLCNINRGVVEVLHSCPSEWDWVIDWLRTTPFTSKSGQQNWSSRPSNMQYEQFINHTSEIACSQYKIKKFEEVKSGQFETHEDEYDSDDDMCNTKFYKGQQIDWCSDARKMYEVGEYKNSARQLNFKTWVSATVLTALDEMICFSINQSATPANSSQVQQQSRSFWVPMDYDYMAADQAMQSRHDVVAIRALRAEIEKKFKKKVQVNQQDESGSQNVMSESANYSNEGAENSSVSD